MRRLAVIATFLLAVGVAVVFWSRGERSGNRVPGTPGAIPGRTETAKGSPPAAQSGPAATTPGPPYNLSLALPAVPRPGSDPADFPIAATLNAPNSTIARDLDIMQQLLATWQSNFPHEGNPVGENAEITSALTGENRLGLALIPKDHPALNQRGELCDRWGTPFRFHQLSGTRMEVRSAGPDRKFGSADDALWTPP